MAAVEEHGAHPALAASAADAPDLPCPFASIATNVPMQLSGMPRQLLHAACCNSRGVFPTSSIYKIPQGSSDTNR